MKLKSIDISEYTKRLKEISNDKDFENGKISNSGLFSEQIFGPSKSYHCSCNKSTYRGRLYKGINGRCPKCNVEITSSQKRRSTYAKIVLPFEVLNPIVFYLLSQYKMKSKKILEDLLFFKVPYIIHEGNFVESSFEEKNHLIGLDGALKYIDFIIENGSGKIIDFLLENKKLISIKEVIVIPPSSRPYNKLSSGKKISDELNLKYSRILTSSKRVKESPVLMNDDNIYRNSFKLIQSQVIDLYDFVLTKLSKKKGLIRQNILGKRVDFSGRGIISPDPDLKLDECSLPYLLILEIFKPQLICHLVNIRYCKLYHEADRFISDCIQESDYSLFDIVDNFCKDKVCVLNRQPSLHRLSILGFKIKANKGHTINIHPMVCNPFNSDFDGDGMAVYIPVTKEAKKDIIDKVGIWRNLISPTDISIVPQPNQDIVLGIYTATVENVSSYLRKKEFKGTQLMYGRYLFNKCLPDDYPVIDDIVDKNKLKKILNDIVLRYPPNIVINVCDNIKSLGFSFSTAYGYTLSVQDFYSKDLEDESKKLCGIYNKDSERIYGNVILNKMKKLPFATYIESGSRGSWDQARQIVFCRGYVADSNNMVRDNLLRSSLVSGLSQEEFFHSSYGSRKGLLDTALSTGDSGYLTRQLIYSSSFVELNNDLEDCGTKDYFELDLTFKNDKERKEKEKLIKTILWRSFFNEQTNSIEQVTIRNSLSLLGKVIKLRSPIYCKSDKICKTCYGNLHNILHSDQIGIVATQAIGERVTQLVLRTFHLSGVAGKMSSKLNKNEDIISGIQFVNKILHNPRFVLDLKLENILDGVVDESEIKNIQKSFLLREPEYLVNSLYSIFNQYGFIHMVHYEILVSAMSWTEDNTLWRTQPRRRYSKKVWTSIMKVPALSSWLLGLAFSNVKTKLLDGLVRKREDTPSSISNLFRYK